MLFKLLLGAVIFVAIMKAGLFVLVLGALILTIKILS